MLALTLDIMIVVLLLISLGAGLRLHGALKLFRVDGNEFQPTINALDKATTRAESALRGLRKIAEEAGGKLNEETRTTQRLLDELDFMTKRADQLAEKLDDSIGKARTAEAEAARTSQIKRAIGAGVSDSPSETKRRRVPDLEQRLKNLR